jgi:hypothetical protein
MGDDIKTRWLLTGLGLFFLAAALAAPVNHDESQYVAAIALMREGLPYRDWPYLQTPLQPLLLSPLALLPAGWLLVGARLANALFALLTCWALLRLLRGRVPFWAAATTIGAMALTNAFLFAAEVARNDALPVALLSLGLLALDRCRALVAGLCFGLAISAKISLALPVAGVGLWMLWQERKAVPAAVLGGVAGLLPCLILYALAPQQFIFGVFTYSMEAPQQFWTAAGQAWRLEASGKLLALGGELVTGATLIAVLIVAADWRRAGRLAGLLGAASLGGLVAAWLPDPFFEQYLVPLLPPLFARATLALPELGHRWRIAAVTAGGATTLVSLAGNGFDYARGWKEQRDLATAVRQGRMVAELAGGRPVASLAPERLAGSNVWLVPGFAAGPFLFRTSDALAGKVRSVTGAPTWQQAALLDRDPPALIVTGGERKPRPWVFPRGVDEPLEQWARSRGYSWLPLPGREWRVWIAPTQKGGP